MNVWLDRTLGNIGIFAELSSSTSTLNTSRPQSSTSGERPQRTVPARAPISFTRPAPSAGSLPYLDG